MTPWSRSESRVILGTVLKGTGATYYIQEVIGEGGQGWVFKASYDDPDGFPVVVKVLRPDSGTKDAFDRFRREAEILRKLSQNNPSPYIVRFYDAGEASFPLPDGGAPGERAQLPFTVLEYVHGESLYQVLERQRGQGLAVRRARRILREVAKALEIVHAQSWGAQFESELAVSGKTGTMASRLNTPALVGRVHAKTGTVRGGRALSGYATTIGGRSVVFSIIGNGDDTKLTTKVMDELVETVVAYDG